MIISLDTETTGVDFKHGAKPFLVTIGLEDNTQEAWEWDVNPLTREPNVQQEDLVEIQTYIDQADKVVFQNAKFDVAALATVYGEGYEWDWDKTYDTLLAAHLIHSNEPHGLTHLVCKYLRKDVQPFEDSIKEITKTAIRRARSVHKDWMLAKKDLPCMPSAKETVWKLDMWLPKAMTKIGESEGSDWATACLDYANSDSCYTLRLFKRQMGILRKRKLDKIYAERMKVLPIAYQMQEIGVTLNEKRLDKMVEEYATESERAGATCVNIADSYGAELILPKSGNNGSLLEAVFEKIQFPIIKKSSKTGKPSLDSQVLDEYIATSTGKKLEFVEALGAKRKRDTALAYMAGYKKFWMTVDGEWKVLYPSLNPTGTDTLRWSSKNPNEQNISKKEGFNIRYCFGPTPGREWWSLDAKNIELRIPAYRAGETEMINLFEKPDEAPYFGSNHLLVFDILHTKRLGLDTSDPEYLIKAQKTYASSWYQWTKNGNFAVQYGAMEKSGTADAAYHVRGGQSIVQSRFRNIARLNKEVIKHARDYGYVETMIDKTVDGNRGYPLVCTIDQWGRIMPTVPLNYFVQGTAMWWMQKAMVRCYNYLEEYNALHEQPIHMIMQVHDEIVFDLPTDHKADKRFGGPGKGNMPIIRKLAKLMEEGGNDLGLPTPVSMEYHPVTWSD